MGHRLSKIYTRTGDKGTTGLGDGSRIAKDHPRVEAFGTVDELNSAIGTVLAYDIPDTVRECFNQIQHDLFDLGGEFCVPGRNIISDKDVAYLEEVLDNLNEALPKLKEFILPSGGLATSHCHLARTICRRAERRCWTFSNSEKSVNTHALAYLNRLSDLLFVVCRVLARHENGREVLWQPREKTD